MNQNQLNQKRDWIKGKFIIGIDPAKDKQQVASPLMIGMTQHRAH